MVFWKLFCNLVQILTPSPSKINFLENLKKILQMFQTKGYFFLKRDYFKCKKNYISYFYFIFYCEDIFIS